MDVEGQYLQAHLQSGANQCPTIVQYQSLDHIARDASPVCSTSVRPRAEGLHARALSSTNWSRKQVAGARVRARGWGWPSRIQDPPQRTGQGKYASTIKCWCLAHALSFRKP